RRVHQGRGVGLVSEHITLTDWRGNTYSVGSNVIYGRMSGRSVELSEGTVIDIWYARYDTVRFKGWTRIDPSEATDKDGLRVKIQPHGPGSRSFYRSGVTYEADGDGGYRRKFGEMKPVMLEVLENITVIPPRSDQ
ncbi:hypothetical protein ACWDTT_16065, partial [Streptosporangium sandarakinum]